MKPLMYRHRPAFPALVGAIICLLGGMLCCGITYHLVQTGDASEKTLQTVILASIIPFGIFLIAAFSRYQFTHLWAKPRRKTPRDK